MTSLESHSFKAP